MMTMIILGLEVGLVVVERQVHQDHQKLRNKKWMK